MLTGPGGQTVPQAARYNESMNFDLEPGVWTVTVDAFFEADGLVVNNPSTTTVTLAEGQTESVAITLQLNSDFNNTVFIPDAETLRLVGRHPFSLSGEWYGKKQKFLLLADLELENWVGYEIAGASSTDWASFHGGGHTITIRSFYTDTFTPNCGLFTDAWRVDFYKLNIVLDITDADNTEIDWKVGGLTAGGSDVIVKDVHVSGVLHIWYTDTYSDGVWGGGIAGELTGGIVAACSSKLDLKLEDASGGTSPGSSVGGILGEMNNIIIDSSFSSGTVEGTRAGGILGAMGAFGSSSDINFIENCYSVGTVKGLNTGGEARAGGIAGEFDGPASSGITSSYSIAGITCDGLSPSYAGGIAGSLGSTEPYSTAEILFCLALNNSISVTSSSSTVQRVVASTSGTFSLDENEGLTTMTLPSSPSYISTVDGVDDDQDKDGLDKTFLTDPPTESDFIGTAFEISEYTVTFAMAPLGWGYYYPILSWQIEKGIQP
jgi:hypothetical protein